MSTERIKWTCPMDNVGQSTHAAFALAGVSTRIVYVYPSRDCGDDPELAMALECRYHRE